MPDGGIEWAFRDLTLCRIVSPQNYDAFKKMILESIIPVEPNDINAKINKKEKFYEFIFDKNKKF